MLMKEEATSIHLHLVDGAHEMEVANALLDFPIDELWGHAREVQIDGQL